MVGEQTNKYPDIPAFLIEKERVKAAKLLASSAGVKTLFLPNTASGLIPSVASALEVFNMNSDSEVSSKIAKGLGL